jgi:UPF0716 family protein affecting phage T7 exclusion
VRRQSPHGRSLPPIFIQVFALAIVTALTVAAIIGKNTPLLLAILAFAGGVVGVNGYFGKIRQDLESAFPPSDQAPQDAEEDGP